MGGVIRGLQGDIFDEWRNGYDLLVLFSHDGFTALNGRLRGDRPLAPDNPELPRLGADDAWQGTPQPLSEGKWFIAFRDSSDQPYGLDDDEVKSAFREVFELCRRQNLKRVLTNGVRGPTLPPTEADHDARVRFLYRLARNRGEVSTTFIDLRDTFVRNPP